MKQNRDETPWFTVFTGTYNRAHTLRRVYDALLSQTMQDFEWLIVDDGSTDGTEALVNEIIEQNRLSIRYIRKTNGGVHTAHNVAVKAATGRLFLRLDSDDYCVPHALEHLLNQWLQIPDRDQYSGVSCLCMSPDDSIIGDKYPSDPWVSNWRTLSTLRGDKWGFHVTEILRDNLFPEFDGEKFCPESLVWCRISKRKRTLCINKALSVVSVSEDSLMANNVRTRYQSPRGTAIYYSEQIEALSGSRAVRSAINYLRFSPTNGGFLVAIKNAPRKLFVTSMLPFGFLAHILDRVQGKYP